MSSIVGDKFLFMKSFFKEEKNGANAAVQKNAFQKICSSLKDKIILNH